MLFWETDIKQLANDSKGYKMKYLNELFIVISGKFTIYCPSALVFKMGVHHYKPSQSFWCIYSNNAVWQGVLEFRPSNIKQTPILFYVCTIDAV